MYGRTWNNAKYLVLVLSFSNLDDRKLQDPGDGNSFASNVITLQAKLPYFACNVFHNFTLTLQAKPPYFACNVAYFETFPLKCSKSEIGK